MASTIDNILSTLRAAVILDAGQINYGVSDGLSPPYLSVLDYAHTYDYQTGGVESSVKTSAFKIVVVDKSQTSAEGIAAQVDALLNCTNNATPATIGCLQTAYRVGQLQQAPYYQFGVEIEYQLTEQGA